MQFYDQHHFIGTSEMRWFIGRWTVCTRRTKFIYNINQCVVKSRLKMMTGLLAIIILVLGITV